MGDTQYFGLSKFGAEGRISDQSYKFSQRDRETIDSLLWTFLNHDHRAVSAAAGLAGPTKLNVVLSTTGGTLPPGTTFYYKVGFRDAAGNETEACPATSVTTASALAPPASTTVSYVSTGGSLATGLYRYALSYYQDAGGETRAPNYATVNVLSGTSTNVNTLVLAPPPNDASGWKVYRRGPNEDEFNYLATIAATSTPPTSWSDDGGVLSDCTKHRPTSNNTNAESMVTITLHADDLPLDSRVVSWRVYRTTTAGVFGGSSLLKTVVETTTEGGTDVVTTTTDTGSGTSTGSPLLGSTTPPPIAQLDASDAFDASSGRLPASLTPLAVHQFGTLLPGTLAQQTYNQFYIPTDMLVERLDGFFLTAPTGLDGSNYLTLRVKDDATQNEVQSIWNNAQDTDEVQYVSNNATAGTFTLSDGVDTTDPILFNELAMDLKTRLETDITAITTVTVLGMGTTGNPWVIIFDDPGGAPFGALTAGDGNLIGGVSTVQVATTGAAAGTLTLTFDLGEATPPTTAAIDWDAPGTTLATPDGSSVEEKLEALANITAVAVTGSGTESDPWLVEFETPGTQNVPMLIADSTNLNGTAYVTEVTKGYGNTIVDLVIDQNQAYHYMQTPLTDFGEQEAEEAPATGGNYRNDALALNDIAKALDTQGEKNTWNLGTLEPGNYVFKYWAAITEAGVTFDLHLKDMALATPADVDSMSVDDNVLLYIPAYEIYYTADGTEDFQLEIEKTDAGSGEVLIDKYGYEADLPTLHAGSVGTVEILVTGSPSTNGDNLQMNMWY